MVGGCAVAHFPLLNIRCRRGGITWRALAKAAGSGRASSELGVDFCRIRMPSSPVCAAPNAASTFHFCSNATRDLRGQSVIFEHV